MGQGDDRQVPDGKQASAVIPLLWRAQEQEGLVHGAGHARYVADMLGMAYIRVYEIATFYTMFQLSPVGRKAHVQVCGTTPCMLRGAEELIEVCQKRIHHDPHHLSADGDFSWEEVECLGSCANAPMVQIFKDTYEDLTPELFEKVLDGFAKGQPPKPGSQIGRQASCPAGGPTTLKDRSRPRLDSAERRHERGIRSDRSPRPGGSLLRVPVAAFRPNQSLETSLLWAICFAFAAAGLAWRRAT